MVKRKIDNRIRVMIENGVKLGHRTMFLIIGDKARDQVSEESIEWNQKQTYSKLLLINI